MKPSPAERWVMWGFATFILPSATSVLVMALLRDHLPWQATAGVMLAAGVLVGVVTFRKAIRALSEIRGP